jgi:hypothetical protein
MCFSAAGSFALSGVLAGVGTVGVARNTSKPHRLFAAIPLLFAAQQAAEGVVWSTFSPSDHSVAHGAAAVAFLLVAMAIWPVWVSLSLRDAERDAGRRRLLSILIGIGVVVAAGSALMMLRSPPVATIVGHSIRYKSVALGNRAVGILLLVAYLVPTIAPFFVSTMRIARTIGVTLVISLIATLVVERDALTSVWCFFAAILSLQTLMAVERVRTSMPRPLPA